MTIRQIVQNGTADADHLLGTDGADIIFGAAGNDTLSGDKRNDILFGDDGDDFIAGGRGADALFGGDGLDQLFGDGGNDTLDGGAGVDALTGGGGIDTFLFAGDAFAANVAGGPTRIAGDGVRQVVNGADTATDNVLDFRLSADTIALDASDFDLDGVRFFNGVDAEGVTDLGGLGDANFIVVGSFANAGAAANAVAAASALNEAGIVLYFNSTLGINRLFYSENLGADNGAGVGTGDINVFAALRDATGEDAIALLSQFEADNFATI